MNILVIWIKLYFTPCDIQSHVWTDIHLLYKSQFKTSFYNANWDIYEYHLDF